MHDGGLPCRTKLSFIEDRSELHLLLRCPCREIHFVILGEFRRVRTKGTIAPAVEAISGVSHVYILDDLAASVRHIIHLDAHAGLDGIPELGVVLILRGYGRFLNELWLSVLILIYFVHRRLLVEKVDLLGLTTFFSLWQLRFIFVFLDIKLASNYMIQLGSIAHSVKSHIHVKYHYIRQISTTHFCKSFALLGYLVNGRLSLSINDKHFNSRAHVSSNLS